MCIREESDLQEVIEELKNSKDEAVVFFRTGHNTFGITCRFHHSENVMCAVRDLQVWHPELKGMEPDLSHVNMKRAEFDLKALKFRRPRTYTPVKGFESAGLSFPELMRELNDYAERRAAA